MRSPPSEQNTVFRPATMIVIIEGGFHFFIFFVPKIHSIFDWTVSNRKSWFLNVVHM